MHIREIIGTFAVETDKTMHLTPSQVHIGDWIEFPDGIKARIASLPFVHGYGICATRIEKYNTMSGVFPLADCKPIQLTDDIINANMDYVDGNITQQGADAYVHKVSEKHWESEATKNIRYVHQLQHEIGVEIIKLKD